MLYCVCARKPTCARAPRIWRLLGQYENKSIVADLRGFPAKQSEDLSKGIQYLKALLPKKNLTDYPEIKIWLRRIERFAKQNTINSYLCVLRRFYNYMKEKHPERARPSLWTSDDINEFVYSLESHLWHWRESARSVAMLSVENTRGVSICRLGIASDRESTHAHTELGKTL